MKKLHIILDIDNTLIDSLSSYDYFRFKSEVRIPDAKFDEANMYIWKRPYLEEFLSYLNITASHISIWTNGTDGWLKFIFNNIIKPHLDESKITFLLSIDFSTQIQINKDNFIAKVPVKEMKKIFNNNSFGFSHNNTILIDDNFYNCWFNKYNSIPSRKYIVINENKKRNKDLLYIIKIIEKLKKSDNISDTLKKVYDGIDNYNDLFDH